MSRCLENFGRKPRSLLTKELMQFHFDFPLHSKTRFSPPCFLKAFRDVRVTPGDRSMFEGVLLGRPLPKTVWLFNDSPVLPEDVIVYNSCDVCRMTIPKTTVRHYGKYTLAAENGMGKAAWSAWLLMP